MGRVFKDLGAQRKAFADWTDRIAAGAYPEAPPRPVGVERNLVISMWDWALPTSRRSDAAGTDEREPTLNANGLIYGAHGLYPPVAAMAPARRRMNAAWRMPSASKRRCDAISEHSQRTASVRAWTSRSAQMALLVTMRWGVSQR